MYYISAQPCNKYFIWQVDTMLTSQEEIGIDMSKVHVVFAALELFEDTEQCYQRLLDKWTPKGVQFFNYMDERDYKGYIPSTKTYLLWKHWQNCPWLENEEVFLTDSDVVFLRKPSDKPRDGKWRVSDCNSYLNWSYVSEKGESVSKLFLEVFEIDEKMAKSRNFHSGGAQYHLQDVPTDYWRWSQLKSEELWIKYHDLPLEKRKEHNTEYDLQVWTAEMWGNLYGGWHFGKEVIVDPDLDFAWSVDNKCSLKNKFLLHNSGVTTDKNGLFYKGKYVLQYPPLDLELDEGKLSHTYYEFVQKALS